MRLLDRYIVRELAPLCLGGTLLFGGIVVFYSPLREALELAREAGISQPMMWKLVGLNSLALVSYLLPIGVLFGSAMTGGRMAATGELVAARVAGLSTTSVMRAGLLFAAALGLLGAVFHEYVAVPATARARDIEESLDPARKGKVQRHIHFVEVSPETGEAEVLVYARRFDPERATLEGVTAVWLGGSPTGAAPLAPVVIRAREATYLGQARWRVLDAVAAYPDGQGPVEVADRIVQFGRSAAQVGYRRRDEQSMRVPALRRMAEELEPQAAVNPTVARVRNAVLMEMWLRASLPMACLPFGLIGISLSARPQGGGLSLALGLSVLAAFLYYTFLRYADVAGREGQLPPALAAWATTAIAFVAGLIMMSRAEKL